MPLSEADYTFIETAASTYRPGDQVAKQDVRDFFFKHPGTRTDLDRRTEYMDWLGSYDGAESLIGSCAALGFPTARATELRRTAARHRSNTYPDPELIEPEAREDHNTHSVRSRDLAANQSQPTSQPSHESILDRLDAFERDFQPGNVLTLPPAGSIGSHPPDPTGGSSTTHKDPDDLYAVDEGDAPPKYRCQGDKKEDMKPWSGNPRWD